MLLYILILLNLPPTISIHDPIDQLAQIHQSMGLPPPPGYKPPLPPIKKEKFANIPNRLQHRYSKIGNALAHTSEVLRFKSSSGSSSKSGMEAVGPSIGRSATTTSSSKNTKKEEEEEILIDCPADAFGRACSERGECDTATGTCKCNKGGMFSSSSLKSIKPFGFRFLELETQQTSTSTSTNTKKSKKKLDDTKGGDPFGSGCEFTTCPVVGGKKCNGQGTCNKLLGECQCFPGWMGNDCSTDPNSLNVFQEDCEEMDDHYIAECIRATTTGACKAYQLTWDRLCFKTCVAVLGKTCDLQQRRDFCSHSPDCEVLCNSMFDISCNRFISENPSSIFDKIANKAGNGTDENDGTSLTPAASTSPAPFASPSSKPYRVQKSGNAKYDRKGGRGNKAGYQRKKAGIANKSGLHEKTEREDGTKKRSKGGMRGPKVGNPSSTDVDTTLEEVPANQKNDNQKNDNQMDQHKDQKDDTKKSSKSGKFGQMSAKEDQEDKEDQEKKLQGAYDTAFPKFQNVGMNLQDAAAPTSVVFLEQRRRKKGSAWKLSNRLTRNRNTMTVRSSRSNARDTQEIASSFLETSSPDMNAGLKHLRQRERAVKERMSARLGFDVIAATKPKLEEEVKLPKEYQKGFAAFERQQQFYSKRNGGQGGMFQHGP